MKKIIIAGAAAIALATPASAELEGDINLTYSSQFNFRGANGVISDILGHFGSTDSDDTFNARLNLAYNFNDNWALTAGANIQTLSDGGGDYDSYRVGALYTTDCYTIELGYQNHNLSTHFGSFDTGEIYLNLATPCPFVGGMINLFVAHDIDDLEGTYVELSLRKELELNNTVGLNVTIGVSYTFDYWENIGGQANFDSGSDWNNAYITVGLPVKVTDNLTVTPFVTYSRGSSALEASAMTIVTPASGSTPAVTRRDEFEEDDEFVFGLSASVKF